MADITRRRVVAGLGSTGFATTISVGASRPTRAQGAGRIVIVGGGAGGASVAAKLKRAAPALDVTLIEARAAYPTCFHSNLVLGGLRTFQSLVQSYDGLRAMGIQIVTAMATDVDTTAKQVIVAGGGKIGYDRLVLSPGISFKFETIEGYSQAASEIMPHAWQAGPQLQLLKAKLEDMADGGTVVMSVPALPYRCPPAPYERACMIAHYLKTNKPKSKLIVLDAKRYYPEQAVFEEAFSGLYKDQIEVVLSDEIDDNTVVRVDAATGEVVTAAGRSIKAAVANIIPPQLAGEIAVKAGCVDGAWCPIRPDSFLSTRVRDVYVLGDSAQAPDMPKSAASAASQAAVVADDILAEVAGRKRSRSIYESNCWSVVAPNDGVKLAASYTPGERDGKAMLVATSVVGSQPGESAEVRAKSYADNMAWYDALTKEAFGG